MNRFGKFMLSGLFILYIFIIGIYMLVTKDHELSNVENRSLAQLPELTSKHVVNGDYMGEFETYFTDQFPGRNVWLKAYTELQLLTNKTYVNDFYIGENDWIMPKPSYSFREKDMNTSTENVNEFAEFLTDQGIEFYYFMVPHKVTLFQSVFPGYMKQSSSDKNREYFLSKLDDDIVAVDMVKGFQEQFTDDEMESMYYKTDHHWNGKGALEAYKVMSTTFDNQLEEFELDDANLNERYYQKECLSSEVEFVGSYNRQIYMTVSSDDNEKMCAYIADNFYEYEVYENGNRVEPEQVYFSVSYEDDIEEVAYSDLYTRDYSELTIVNPNLQEGNLLIIKDSYANALVYHVAQNFHQTTIYDIRHNDKRSVKDFILENDVDYVAIVYNSESLTGDVFEFGVIK